MTDEIKRLLDRAFPSAWFRRAHPKRTERERVEAIGPLREIWRGQIDNWNRAQDHEAERYRIAEEIAVATPTPEGVGPKRVPFEPKGINRTDYVDPRFDRFFEEAGRELLAAANPEKALAEFLGIAKRPGRRIKVDVEDDVRLVVQVRSLRAKGVKGDAAFEALAENAEGRWGDADSAKKAYYRALRREAVRGRLAEIGMAERERWWTETPAHIPVT